MNMVVELKVRHDKATGKTTVDGPLDDRILCFGMLEEAKQIVERRYIKATGPGQRQTRPESASSEEVAE